MTHRNEDLQKVSSSVNPSALEEQGSQERNGRSTQRLWPDFLIGQGQRPVRVMLIDDDPHVRHVIAQELLSDTRIDLVGQADSLREGRRLVMRQAFDVLLVDLNLGDGSGFSLIEYVKACRCSAEVVVISVLENEAQVLRAFELGASGYLVKNCWFQNYAQAVLQVVNGGAAITPGLARRLLHRFEIPWGTPAAQPSDGNEASSISSRERDVLRWVASGSTSAEIATRLEISVQTVNSHIKNIYRKLHVHSRAQAVILAARRRLL